MFCLFQFPAITICPARVFKADPTGFVEKYLNMLDPAHQENRDLFRFIPEELVNYRIAANRELLRYLPISFAVTLSNSFVSS